MKSIRIFTTNNCGYCGMVKKWLDSKKIKYEVVNLDTNTEYQKEIYAKSGALTVPVTLVEEDGIESVIVGYNLSRLSSVVL